MSSALPLGWIALLVGLLGLAASLWQERSRQSLAVGHHDDGLSRRVLWLIAGHGSLVYGRYALPMAPMMSFWLGLGVMTLGRWIGSSSWPRARLGMAALGLIFVPPLSTSISWDLGNARVSTVDQAREWIAGNVRPAQGVAVEDVMLDLPRDAPHDGEAVDAIGSLASYESDGIVYLVTTSQESHAAVDSVRLTSSRYSVPARPTLDRRSRYSGYRPRQRRAGAGGDRLERHVAAQGFFPMTKTELPHGSRPPRAMNRFSRRRLPSSARLVAALGTMRRSERAADVAGRARSMLGSLARTTAGKRKKSR